MSSGGHLLASLTEVLQGNKLFTMPHVLNRSTAVPFAEPEFKLQPKARIGPYELVSMIGKGGFGQIWLAIDHSLDPAEVPRQVALKFLAPSHGRAPSKLMELKFVQEGEILIRLKDSGISGTAVAYDYKPATLRHPAYIVMPRLEGMDLNQLLFGRSGFSVEPREFIGWMIQLLTVLDQVHLMGIAHRDVKFGNLFFTKDNQLLLIDFGIAKLVQDTGETQTVMGTRNYSPPEVFSPRSDRSSDNADAIPGQRFVEQQKRDVYAVGMLLYKYFTGETAQVLVDVKSGPLNKFAKLLAESKIVDAFGILNQEMNWRESLFMLSNGPGAVLSRKDYQTIEVWLGQAEETAADKRQTLYEKVPHDLAEAICRAIYPLAGVRFPNATAFREELLKYADPDQWQPANGIVGPFGSNPFRGVSEEGRVQAKPSRPEGIEIDPDDRGLRHLQVPVRGGPAIVRRSACPTLSR